MSVSFRKVRGMSERGFRRTLGGVSSLGLHVVWCPKYRRRILGGRVARRLSVLLEQVADEHGWQIVAILWNAPPSQSTESSFGGNLSTSGWMNGIRGGVLRFHRTYR